MFNPMKRAPLYRSAPETAVPSASPEPPPLVRPPTRPRPWRWLGALGLGVLLGGVLAAGLWRGEGRALTQADIDAAVLHTLQNQILPSKASQAAAVIAPSVVAVRGFLLHPATGASAGKAPTEVEMGIGSGVVIKEDGTLVTNIHVVAGASRIRVVFFDGSEADARLVAMQPDNDIAVLKPDRVPDDLQPAVMAGSRDLRPGDEVVAVGFPFGIGPSVSAGVVSGLDREFKAEDKKVMRGLIQFDAAANPGNSGGPLVNMAGEVVGIVTAILNPSGVRTFIGIGFAATIESAGMMVGIPPF